MNLLCSLVGALTVFYTLSLAAAQGSTGFGPYLQEQFLVGRLPNVTWSIGRQYAGNLPIQRGTNLSLFFWGIETKPGSLTAPPGVDKAPWNIWLNGYVAHLHSHNLRPHVFPAQVDAPLPRSGPGSSSLLGLLHEVCATWTSLLTSHLTQFTRTVQFA